MTNQKSSVATISWLQVLKSQAGWYIGRTSYDPELNMDVPYNRESDYFKTQSQAEQALKSLLG